MITSTTSGEPWVLSPVPDSVESNQKLSAFIQFVYTNGTSHPHMLQGIRMGKYVLDTSKKNVSITIAGQVVKIEGLNLSLYFFGPSSLTQKCKFRLSQRSVKVISSSIVRDLPIECFQGNELERRIFLKDSDVAVFEKEYWDKWDSGSVNYHAMSVYESIIYPEIIKSIHRIGQSFERKLDILDLGGGSGKLAYELLNKCCNIIQQICLIDFSEVAIERAKGLLENHANKFKAICKDITQMSFLSPDNLLCADVIILSGIIAFEVLTPTQALQLLKKCHTIVRDNGYLIVTSYSLAIVNSKDYEKMGYRVLNKTIAGKAGSKWDPYDFFILQKSSIP